MPRDRDVPLSLDGSWQRNGSVWSKRISFLISFPAPHFWPALGLLQN